MQRTKQNNTKLSFIIFVIVAGVMWSSCLQAASEKNSLTFINESGDYVLVKLVGPSHITVAVSDGSRNAVKIASGVYQIYSRYGKGSNYRYTRGEVFTIEDPVNGYVNAYLTLHGVVDGNYRTYGSSGDEFERQ